MTDIEGAAPFYYSCEHGESNTPDVCQMRAWALTSNPGDPPPAEVAADWHLTLPAGDGSLTDSVSFGG